MMIHRVVVFRHYSRVAGIFLALSQLILGASLIGIQVGGIFQDIISTHLGATGIWAGVFIIFCGIAGLMAAHLRTTGALLSFLVLSILSTLACPAVVITSAISIMELKHYCDGSSNIQRCAPQHMESQKLLDLALITVAVFEYCLAASCFISCCWTLCCDPAGYQVEYEDMQKSAEEQRSENSMEMQPQYEGIEDGFSVIEEEEE